MNTINQRLQTIFTPLQIEAMKDAFQYGAWGDDNVCFNGSSEWELAIGACTNDIKNGGRFSGRQVSGIISGICKRILGTRTNLISVCPDAWGDGSGDMMYFNVSALGIDDDPWGALEEWSKDTLVLSDLGHVDIAEI